MSAQSFETILARLYTDPQFLELFLAKPDDALALFPLTDAEKQDLLTLDKCGLVMAAHSFGAKRDKRTPPGR